MTSTRGVTAGGWTSTASPGCWVPNCWTGMDCFASCGLCWVNDACCGIEDVAVPTSDCWPASAGCANCWVGCPNCWGTVDSWADWADCPNFGMGLVDLLAGELLALGGQGLLLALLFELLVL